jgi:hypothetical protein
MRILSTGTFAALATLGAVAACGSADGDGSSGGSGAASAGGNGATGFGGSSASGFGGNGASSAGGTINVTGGSSGASGSSPLGDAACAQATYEGEQIPLDMFVVYDKSGSMQPIWDTVKNAFFQFVQSPESAGIGMGLMFFPPTNGAGANCPAAPPCPPGCLDFFGLACVSNVTTSCAASDYLPPAVNIQALPAVAPQIEAALNGTSPNGGTPTLPAMQAAVGATTAYAKTVPAHKVVIVLQTDGEPNDCNSDIPGVSAEAAKGVAASPSVLTFVIGIGNIAGLNQIAQAGGTNQAIQVDAANPGQAFLDAMNDIRGQALSCEFQLPDPGAGQTVDPSQVNVFYGGQVVYNVPDVSKCDPAAGGWYYNGAKDRVLLCPASCDRIEAEKGRIDIELGCETIVIPA